MQLRRRIELTALLAAITVCVIGLRLEESRSSSLDGTSLQQQVMSIASELHSPGDHNSMTVANSSLPAAQEMRYQIQQDLIAGQTRQQIVNTMVSTYGSSVLAAPRFRGLGSLVWVLPWTALLAIAGLTALYISRTSWNHGRERIEWSGRSESPRSGVGSVRDSQSSSEIAQKIQDYM